MTGSVAKFRALSSATHVASSSSLLARVPQQGPALNPQACGLSIHTQKSSSSNCLAEASQEQLFLLGSQCPYL